MENYEEGKYKTELENIDDEKLNQFLSSAEIAKNKQKNYDYVIGYNQEENKKEVQIVSLDTGRIQHGSRWSYGIHEFVEVKEGLEPETESCLIGSISHPTFFENYKNIFGLTGTIGEETERNEMKLIYQIDCYNIPRNFKQQLIEEPTEIYENKYQKFERIIEIITENYLNQPLLVLLQNIQESLEFSQILKLCGYKHLILNDIQKENEDFILNNSGEKNSILVATNAAGRGTDIIINDEAKKLGGLFVIMAFFPENSRIEFQGIGRAGRQGNPGRAKIIFSRDEPFIYGYNRLINKSDDHKKMIKSYYDFRKNYVEYISNTRIEFSKKERVYYFTMKKYFKFKKFFVNSFKDGNYLKHYFRLLNLTKVSYDYYIKFVLMNFDDEWAEFYSNFVNERGNMNIRINKGYDYFIDFIDKLCNSWSKIIKDIYNEKFKKEKNNDLILMILKNLKDLLEKDKSEKNKEKLIDLELEDRIYDEFFNSISLKNLLR